MTISLALPLIAAVLGGVLFFGTTNTKISPRREILLFSGVLAFLLTHK
jgi:hypothetical protein